MPLWGKQPQERVCEANWRRSLCAAKLEKYIAKKQKLEAEKKAK